jgi:uncharacterized protein YukE
MGGTTSAVEGSKNKSRQVWRGTSGHSYLEKASIVMKEAEEVYLLVKNALDLDDGSMINHSTFFGE